MQRSELTADKLRDSYIICICEGAAEEAVIDLMLDANRLIFHREQLIDGGVTRKRKACDIETEYLHRDYEKPVNIIRVLDSRKESFKLGKIYADRYRIYNVYTRPEIEMLLIISEKHYDNYTQKIGKEKGKPSEYCKSILFPCDAVKSKKFWLDYFREPERLIGAIRRYHQLHGRAKEMNLSHLLRW